MKKEILKLASEWLAFFIPSINPISKTIEEVYSLSDKILFNKLHSIMMKQDDDFNEW